MTLDHVFICTSAGAPAAGRLIEFGLREGTPNRHPGQGTACRRFFFRNGMLELLWVEDTAEAQSEQTRRTRLWDRWSDSGASPFGVIVRPADRARSQVPFVSWEYRPASMPDLSLHIASGTQLAEPMWCYMETGRRPDEAPPERRQPFDHPAGFREITGFRLHCPRLDGAVVTPAMAQAGVISLGAGANHLLELEFDGNKTGNSVDFRPDLPLVFRW